MEQNWCKHRNMFGQLHRFTTSENIAKRFSFGGVLFWLTLYIFIMSSFVYILTFFLLASFHGIYFHLILITSAFCLFHAEQYTYTRSSENKTIIWISTSCMFCVIQSTRLKMIAYLDCKFMYSGTNYGSPQERYPSCIVGEAAEIHSWVARDFQVSTASLVFRICLGRSMVLSQIYLL